MNRSYLLSAIAIASLVAGIALRGSSPDASAVFLIIAATVILAHFALSFKRACEKWEVKGILGPGRNLGRVLMMTGLGTLTVGAVIQLLGLSRLVANLIAYAGLTILLVGMVASFIAAMSRGDKRVS